MSVNQREARKVEEFKYQPPERWRRVRADLWRRAAGGKGGFKDLLGWFRDGGGRAEDVGQQGQGHK